MTQVVSRAKTLSETRKIKKALRQQQQQAVQSAPEPSTPSPSVAADPADDYQTRFNLRELKIVVSPITFFSDGTVTLRWVNHYLMCDLLLYNR